MVNDEILREIVRMRRSAMNLAIEIKESSPKATEQALKVCLEIERLFNAVYDVSGGVYYG